MAELICRTLRDGLLEGEHAPALTIKDTRESPHGCLVFNHVLSQLSSSVLTGKSQSKAIVVVSYTRSPKFYLDLLEKSGVDVTLCSCQKLIKILDCYSDPLGWKQQHRVDKPGNDEEASQEASGPVRVVTEARNLDNLCSLVLEEGKGLVGQGKVRFSVAIDSVSDMLRHSSMLKVAGMLSSLRSHGQVSSTFWLLHSDLHEDKVGSALEYMSSMIAAIEPVVPCTNEQGGNQAKFSLLEKNFGKGKVTVRFKRRNGRVRIMHEAFNVNKSGINFSSAASGSVVNQLVPKVQFNLQLSDKERKERADVILPFEHQGNGKPMQIYDGRRSLLGEKNNVTDAPSDSGEGEIIYFRDSEDEMPDSDEDPDDDLDI